MSLSETIKHEARALGFDAVGISRVVPSPQRTDAGDQPDPLPASSPPSGGEGRGEGTSCLFVERLMEWLRRGYHGVMAWMERDPQRRADPTLVLPGCRSVISVGMNYFTGQQANEGPGYGRIASYAWGHDYHRVLGNRLEQLEDRIKALAPKARTRSYVDTGPVMEKAWAQQAGLGWIGKHTNLVSTQFGSWLLLGEILTTLDLDPDEPAEDLCGTCALCIKACPTGAIVEPYVVDARRCVSYLTIELRSSEEAIPDDLAIKMGNRIFGCDDCLDICPYNIQAQPTEEPAFRATPLTLAPSLQELAELDEPSFTAMFHKSPIRRTKLAGLRRNVSIACDNESRHQAAISLSAPNQAPSLCHSKSVSL